MKREGVMKTTSRSSPGSLNNMEEQQLHRGFVITVSVRDDCDGRSAVTVLAERMSRSGGIDRKSGRILEPSTNARWSVERPRSATR